MRLGRRPTLRVVSPHRSRGARALTAAGQRVHGRETDNQRRLLQPWQAKAFAYYDQIPEIKYAAQFYARGLAPLKIYAAQLDDRGNPEETDNEVAQAMVNRIQDPGGGRSGLLSAYGRLQFLVGEAQLLVSNDPEGGEQWEMLSHDELRLTGNGYARYKAPSFVAEELREAGGDDDDPEANLEPIADGEAVAYRLWNRHPRFSYLADSTMQAVLEVCEELVGLTHAVRSRIRSRIASAGILIVNGKITVVPLEPGPDEDPESDSVLDEIINAATRAISDPGSASAVVPVVLRVDGDVDVDKVLKHIKLVDPTELYPETGLRNECVKRLAIGLDMPPEVLLGMTDANHWPCDEQTEVFTQDRGFVAHDRLAAGDAVLALDHESGRSVWSRLSGVRREHVVDKEMVRVETPSVDALTTPDHRWPILRRGARAWTDGEGLRPEDRIIRAVPHEALPSKPTHADAFVELVAWYATEGTCTWTSERNCQVRIGQSHGRNPENVARIRRALVELHGPASRSLIRPPGTPRGGLVPPAWRERAEERGMTLFHLNKTAYAPILDAMESWRSKVVSREFVARLTRPQLLLFLETFARGDGTLRPGGGLSVNQRDPERLEPVALAAVLAGRPTSFRRDKKRGGYSGGDQHYVNVPALKGHDVPAGKTRREAYTGIIFCPQVPVGQSFLARRNGKAYFTGNSAWQVDEQTWKAHLQPVAQRLVDDLTASYLRPTLRAAGVEGWQTYCVAYDATAVINHPDRGRDAKDAHDRGEIGGAALREALGFTDDDQPTEEERVRFIGIKVRDGSLALYGIPSKLGTGGIEPEPGQVEDGSSAGAVEPGPPPEGGSSKEETIPGTVVGAADGEAILGPSYIALQRAREIAGARLRNLAKRDPAAARALDGVPNSRVPASLGKDRATAIGAPPPAALIAGFEGELATTFSLWGLDGELVGPVAEAIAEHAAATLYHLHPAPLPAAFTTEVKLAREKARA